MRKILCAAPFTLGAALLLLSFGGWGQAQPETKLAKIRLANLRQLTHGGENAEAYWAPDGKRLIFQSTRDGHDCDQIYIMKAVDGSELRFVSICEGVTTI